MDNNMSNNNEFTNFFPISDSDKPTDAEEDTKTAKNLSVLNIGQIILLVILCTVICLQTAELLSSQSLTEPLQVYADYHSPQNIYDNSERNGFVEYTNMTGEKVYSVDHAIDANELNNGESADNLIETTPSEPEVIFILGESEGRLAILSADGQIVYETFNVHINTLPPLDRDLLREGIRITTTEELSSLLEDFSS